ncbi:MAG: caspase family protein [Candidatus Aminicenantes bacterium]|nr:caspase family protein [Candidatus Aminicenantes bacterium]
MLKFWKIIKISVLGVYILGVFLSNLFAPTTVNVTIGDFADEVGGVGSGGGFIPDKQFALLIGIDKYREIGSMDNATRDVRALREILIEKYSFKSTNIIELYNEEATHFQIESVLRALTAKLAQDKGLFIYFSGHGYIDDVLGISYWLPSDVGVDITRKNRKHLDDSELIKKSGFKIGQEIIRGVMRKSRTAHIFIVIDAMFNSEDVYKHKGSVSFLPLENKKSRQLLTAGRKGANSGSFVTVFRDFLKENKKKYLVASEIISKVRRNLTEKYKQKPIGGHFKVIENEGGEFVFYLDDIPVREMKSAFRTLRGDLESSEMSSEQKLKECQNFVDKYENIAQSGTVRGMITSVYGYMISIMKKEKKGDAH